jgi:hypothetical protein
MDAKKGFALRNFKMSLLSLPVREAGRLSKRGMPTEVFGVRVKSSAW